MSLVSIRLHAGLLVFASVALSGCGRPSVPEEVAPVVKYVETFRDAQNRLPTDGEFQEWAARNYPDKKFEYYSKRPPSMSEWGRPGIDFIAGGWDGVCFVYFQSWNKKTFDGSLR